MTLGVLQTGCRAQQADRASHTARQAASFNPAYFPLDQPPEVLQRLDRIVAAVPGLGPESRVLDVGSGTGALIPHLQHRGVADILAVDLSSDMLRQLRSNFPCPGTLGNNKGVRIWQGGVEDVPAYEGPFDAAFFNAVFGNVFDQREALLCAALLLRAPGKGSPGGHIVISHPLGRGWLADLHAEEPEIVPHLLPGAAELEDLISDLPLEVVAVVDEDELYSATLRIPEGFSFRGAPIAIGGRVVTGFGRGSKQMGVPTANLAPEPLAALLEGLPNGVYFGFARLQPSDTRQEADSTVHKMVMNIGQRPTMEDDGGKTVELHILHQYAADFYGQQLQAVVLGYLRPEMKFTSLNALIARIKTDVGIARTQLDLPMHSEHADSLKAVAAR